MSAARVVEAVDVFRCPAMVCLQTMREEEGNFDLPAGPPVSAPDHFRLEGFEKSLNCGIVIAVTFAAHRCRQTMFSQDLLIVMGTVLAARCPATVCLQTVRGAIRVMNVAFRRSAQRNGHVQGTDREVFLHPVADGPTYHPARMQIEYDRQIHPAYTRPDIGDVACLLAGRRCLHRRKAISGWAGSRQNPATRDSARC